MQNLILSLLLIKNMTIYEMKTYIERFLNGVCSSSVGSLQVALKKLLEDNMITYSEYEENGHKKKEYQITSEGVSQFMSWIQIPMNWNKAKNMEESKFFFLGILPKEQRLILLQKLITNLKEDLKQLQMIQQMVEGSKAHMVESNVERMNLDETIIHNILSISKAPTIEYAVKDIVTYQIYLLEYGFKKVENDLTFFSMIYERELNSDPE